MYGVSIEGDFSPLTEFLGRMLAMRDAVGSLADGLAEDMIDGNRVGLLAGTDRFGDAMPVTRRQLDPALSARFGDGEPLNPNGSASRSISDFTVHTERQGDALSIVGRWPSTPFIRFHRRDHGFRPARDIVGVRPETIERMRVRVREWAESYVGDAI